MTNIYRRRFVSHCPENGDPIDYEWIIESDLMLYAEHIAAASNAMTSGFHEEIAEEFFAKFGGRQIIKAHHHGVDIETRRGFDAADGGRLTQRVTVGSTVYEKGVQAIRAIEAIYAVQARS